MTDAEAELLAVMVSHPVECAMCHPICGAELITVGVEDRSIGEGLIRDGRAVLWPCKYTKWRHGRITDTGRLALRLRSLVTA